MTTASVAVLSWTGRWTDAAAEIRRPAAPCNSAPVTGPRRLSARRTRSPGRRARHRQDNPRWASARSPPWSLRSV